MASSSPKKSSATAMVKEVAPFKESSCQINPEHAERMDGAFVSIICSAAIPCGLIMIIAGALIGVILCTRISRDEGYPELQDETKGITFSNSNGVLAELNNFKKTGGNPAFFIHFNPSSLTAIATLTGKVIPYLSSSIMALVAFFAARRIIVSSRDTNDDNLLSPHQLAILIGLLGGSSLGPLNDCVKYHFKNKQKWISPLPHAFTALAAATLLGILIPLVDTWFSTTVTPATIATVSKSNYTSTFGRMWNTSDCSGLTATADYNCATTRSPCNLDCITKNDNQKIFFMDGTEAATEALHANSATNYVSNYGDPKTEKVYYYMADATVISNLYARDFQNNTLAVETQCNLITSRCFPEITDGMAQYVGTYDFHCPNGFNGSLLSNGASSAARFNTTTLSGGNMAGITFFSDAQMSDRIKDSEFASLQNPLHFGTWSVGWQAAPWNDEDDTNGFWDSDPEIFFDVEWNYVWMLNCSSTIYDVTYSFFNGSITKWDTSLAQQDSGGLLSLPFVSGLPLGTLSLELATTDVNSVQNSSQLTSVWSQQFSRYGMAILAGTLQPAGNHLEQKRNNSHAATRVPMIPLFLLLGLKVLYCLAVLLLAFAAWYCTNPRETQSVKERLTVKGLAAAYFADGSSHQKVAVKNVEQLFQDSTKSGGKGEIETAEVVTENKVGMKPTDLGGWEFVKLAAGTVWTQVEPIFAGETIAQANAGVFGTSGQDAAELVSLIRK